MQPGERQAVSQPDNRVVRVVERDDQRSAWNQDARQLSQGRGNIHFVREMIERRSRQDVMNDFRLERKPAQVTNDEQALALAQSMTSGLDDRDRAINANTPRP
jgi:hypothetical protein